MRGFSLTVFIILVINLAIVWYLVKNRNRLFHHHHHGGTGSKAGGLSA
jgi:hypothetical protein